MKISVNPIYAVINDKKQKKMYTPKLVQNDPWLKPYEATIKKRLDRALTKEESLSGDNGTLNTFANGHLFFGLHRESNGWVFREWAPNATKIYLIGDFTNWQETESMALSNKGNYWEIHLPANALEHGNLYKLSVYWNGGKGERLPAWVRRTVQDSETKIFSAQVWEPEKPYTWKKQNFKREFDVPLIYEVHIGIATEEEKVGTYDEFRIKVLPKVKKAGYNTIQMMAVQEHPYYGSFGYHVSGFFAASSRFGTPEELKRLIDEAHKQGIAVIMDIVHSHAVKNELEGLGRFDGTEYQYFHQGEKGLHPAWDSRCFDYGKNEVLHFLLSNCKFWLDEYRFDGFRFDGVTSMLYLDHGLGRNFTSYDFYFDGHQDEDAITYLILANKLIHEINPQAISIAEEMSGMPGLASPLEKGGYGFDYRLAMGIPDFWIKIIKEQADEQWNVNHMFYELTQSRADEKAISYAESHDQAIVGDKTLAFRLMDKEMYFSMQLKQQNLIVDRGMALHKMIRLVTLTTANHGYLNFMGNEFGHPEWIDFPREGNGWSYHYARRLWSLQDNEDLRYKFLSDFDKDMVSLVNSNKSFFWHRANLVYTHESDQVLIYERAGLLFVFNFNPVKSFSDYKFEYQPGDYKMCLNIDSALYGGHGRLDENVIHQALKAGKQYYAPYRLSLYLPCQTAFVLIRG
jgi:1,4-alpha-glucan branching enzyme